MSKRTKARIGSSILVVIALVGLICAFFDVEKISMTQASIQAKIDAKMPATQKGVTVSDAKLDLADNKIGLSFEATTVKMKTEYKLHITTKGTLRYDHSRGSFYFHPEAVKVTDIRVSGQNVADKVGAFVDKWVDSKKIQEHKAELMKSAEEWAQGLVQKAAEMVLERTPVYTVKDDFKGFVVRAALEDVEVKDGCVVAHLSIWQLTTVMIGYLLLFIIAVAFLIVLAMNPELLSLASLVSG